MDTTRDEGTARTELNLVEIPLEGLAAYWLSLKKLLDERLDKSALQTEADYTRERFVRFLLEGVLSGLTVERFERLAAIKKRAMLTDMRRKFAAMRMAIKAVAEGDSPRMTLIRMLAAFPVPPIAEERASELSKALQQALREKPDDAVRLVGLDMQTKPDRMLVKLLFLLTVARRDGKAALRPHLPSLRVPLLAEGLSLTLDGLDVDTVRGVSANLAASMLTDGMQKLDLCVDMALGLKAGMPYEELYLTAMSYIP